uniref:ElaC ribonuclease Z 1 n=1 Tax=Petromyzon marinus TaxID=7757 RepID=S4RTU8_PETMA
MSLEVTALGTGAAFPSPRRGTSAVALRLPDGSLWLFDCGEGTQTQLMRSPLKPGRVTKIFITHLHGDHVFGLPGLMCSLSMLAFGTADAAAPLEVFGPVGLRRLLRVALQLSRSQLGFRFAVHELRPAARQWSAADGGDWRPPEEVRNTPKMKLSGSCTLIISQKSNLTKLCSLCVLQGLCMAAVRPHPQEEPGREITEPVPPWPLLTRCASPFPSGVPPGPLYGRLKAGEAVTLPSGRVLLPGEVADPPVPGRLVAVFGDCSEPLGPAALRLCQGADLLVHEATLEDGLQEKARLRGHSTPSGAAA